MDAKNDIKFNSLESLRGLAALSVVFYHLGLLPSAYLSVDFFFILSGFILSHRYIYSSPPLPLKSFVLKRLIRLYPMYLFSLLVMATAILLFSETTDAIYQHMEQLYLQITMTQNLGFDIHQPFWNYPGWSISVEFWVSLLIVFFITKTVKWWNLVIPICICYTLIITNSSNMDLNNQLFHGYVNGGIVRGLLSFLLGALAYKIYASLKDTKTTHFQKNIQAYQIILLTLTTFLYFICSINEQYLNFIAPLLFMPLIVAFTYDHSILAKILLRIKYLGTISYSLYLNQTVVICLYTEYFNHGNLPIFIVVCLILSVLILYSHLTYKWIEVPSKHYFEKLMKGPHHVQQN